MSLINSKYERVIIKNKDPNVISNAKGFKRPPKKSDIFIDCFLNSHVSGG